MIQQNTEEWLKLRQNYLGASDAPIIMNVSPWKSRYSLWEEKLGLRESQQTNAAMQRGHELEPIARSFFEELTGNKVEPRVVFHEEHKYMMASLDGISQDGSVAVEIKCPGKKSHELARQGIIPDVYYPQLQHQLAILGLNRLHYFSYFSEDDFILLECERDDAYIENLIAEEGAFWQLVKNFEAPEMGEKDFITREDEEWKIRVDSWRTAKEGLDFWKEQEQEARKALIDIAGGQSTKGFDVKVQRVTRKGSVDYSLVPELQGIDIDKYRKGSIQTWRIS